MTVRDPEAGSPRRAQCAAVAGRPTQQRAPSAPGTQSCCFRRRWALSTR